MGIHVNIRLEEDRLCLLVVIGVRPDGTKELIAVEDGYRESTASWLSPLRDLKSRGMKAPVVAVGDGALGFWAAVRQVWHETREQRCWVHRLANVLDKLPQRLQAKAKEALHEVLFAKSCNAAEQAVAAFVSEYGAEYPKAVDALTRDQAELLTFFDFPAEHWKSLRTTNVGESPFRDRPAPLARNQGQRRARERPDDGLQAARDGRATLARARWRFAAPASARWRALHEWSADRENRPGREGRLITPIHNI